ncbi:hypothetical protein BX589_124129 [Paraburkholderia fungorum]|nr:hypothetical protein BX589_124129 [Paraburkholderia fungorum]
MPYASRPFDNHLPEGSLASQACPPFRLAGFALIQSHIINHELPSGTHEDIPVATTTEPLPNGIARSKTDAMGVNLNPFISSISSRT